MRGLTASLLLVTGVAVGACAASAAPASAESATAVEDVGCPGASDPIDPLREIEIVDPSVTDETKNGGLSAAGGPWSVTGLVNELAPRLPGTDTPDIDNFITGTPGLGRSSLTGTHFDGYRLSAIANRIDLRDATSAGEGRFVFSSDNHTDAVIFEFHLSFIPGDLDTAAKWAAAWHRLSTIPFGPAYNEALQAITARFTKRQNGVAPAISQVRAELFNLGWDMFELHLGADGRMALATVANSPNLELNGTRAVSAFIDENLAVLKGPRASLLAMPATFSYDDNGGTQTVQLLGQFTRNDSAPVWRTETGATIDQVYGTQVAATFDALGCGGCHAGESLGTQGNIFQVSGTSTKPDGTDRLSKFMYDPSKPDNAANPPDELRRRAGDVQRLLCGQAPVRVTFIIDGADFTKPGEDLVIVGSDPAIGSWNLDGGTLRMDAAAFPRWTATVDLPRGAAVDYKAVSVKGNAPVLWETGANHHLVLPNAESLVVHGTFAR